MWRGHHEEAKRGPSCGPRLTRNEGAMVPFLLPCATTGLSQIAGWCVMGETPWGQPWLPVLTLPHVRAGLSGLLIAVWCTFRRLSMCRPGHRELMRNELRNLTAIVPATACHPRNDVETYSRSIQTLSFGPCCVGRRPRAVPRSIRFGVEGLTVECKECQENSCRYG